MSPAIDPLGNDDEWEVCNDDGFIYKRRRRLRLELPEGPPPEDIAAELRRQKRARKRRCLLAIRDKYEREIKQWEDLSASIIRLASPLTSTSDAGTSSIASPQPSSPSLPMVDDLLVEVEAQEMVLRKLSDFCDCVDSFCEAQEERLTQSLISLPVWGSPRALMRSLCS